MSKISNAQAIVLIFSYLTNKPHARTLFDSDLLIYELVTWRRRKWREKKDMTETIHIGVCVTNGPHQKNTHSVRVIIISHSKRTIKSYCFYRTTNFVILSRYDRSECIRLSFLPNMHLCCNVFMMDSGDHICMVEI